MKSSTIQDWSVLAAERKADVEGDINLFLFSWRQAVTSSYIGVKSWFVQLRGMYLVLLTVIEEKIYFMVFFCK